MRRALAAALLLAACTTPPAQPLDPAGYVAPDYEIPLAIRALLPRGVTSADVLERDGCYAYRFRDAILYPVQRPDGGQYCIG